jgi:hypothetical protein
MSPQRPAARSSSLPPKSFFPDRDARIAEMSADAIAWSTVGQSAPGVLPVRRPTAPSREWAWGGATGHGVRVCVVDSGIEADHPQVGAVQGAVTVEARDDGRSRVVADESTLAD